jgi:transposase
MSVKNRKPRRNFTKEFKQEAVNLVLKQGLKPTEVAKDLGLNSAVIGRWILQSKAEGHDAFPGKGKSTPSDQHLRDLEAENKRLRMERDILKNYLAWESTSNCDGRNSSEGVA